MNAWIRLYREALHDPKIVSLTDRQHRAWINCLMMADDDGYLPAMRDVACHMRATPADAEQLITDLVEVGLIDPEVTSGPAKFRLHGWERRQYKSDTSTQRVRKFRNKAEGNGDETFPKRRPTVTVTPPDSETDSESETEGHTDRPGSLAAREERTDGRTPAYGDLKKAFNGSTEAMLVFIERAMGGRCRPNAEQWLSSTVAAYGQTAVAQAFAALVEKQAAGEISSRPLPHWSSIARGMKDRQRPPRAGPADDKPSLSEILRRKREAEASV